LAIDMGAELVCVYVWLGYAPRVDWDDFRFILMVARHRTLSAAARKLAVTQPTVGRRIAAIERRLGAKLFVRRSDGFTLSSSGMRVLEHAERMEQDAFAAERRVSGRDAGVGGTVRITASEWLVTSVLSPVLEPLLRQNPELAIELLADPRHVNLAQGEADLALRPRRFEHDAIVQRSVAKIGFGLYAARRYLAKHGVPTPGIGRGHTLIAMTDEVGDVARNWLRTTLPEATLAVRTNGRDAMLALTTAGIGLACLARIVGDSTPALQRVATSTPAPAPMLFLGVHRDMRSTPRVRAVAAHLTERLRALQPKLCPAD
jgi:DNA-binding transcriptional LysR family regulator